MSIVNKNKMTFQHFLFNRILWREKINIKYDFFCYSLQPVLEDGEPLVKKVSPGLSSQGTHLLWTVWSSSSSIPYEVYPNFSSQGTFLNFEWKVRTPLILIYPHLKSSWRLIYLFWILIRLLIDTIYEGSCYF